MISPQRFISLHVAPEHYKSKILITCRSVGEPNSVANEVCSAHIISSIIGDSCLLGTRRVADQYTDNQLFQFL